MTVYVKYADKASLQSRRVDWWFPRLPLREMRKLIANEPEVLSVVRKMF